MKRFFKPIVVLAALLTALILTVFRAGPQGLAGLSVAERTSRAAGPSESSKPYDLASLRILNLTLQRIRDNYVDPTRIDPKGMLLSALDHVQRNVAEVLAEPSPDKNSISVRVDTAQKNFDISGVDSPWALSSKLREIFKFVQANLPQSADAREIEYQAISGMLATLDPHSQLLDPDMYRQMKIDTRGKFGGLGIGIGIRRDMLTVLSILGPQTPAARAGLKAGDHVVRINDESTINMLLSEAVNRLRGDPGTKVTVYIERDNQKGTKKVVLERAIIDVPNVVGLPPAEYSHPKILKAGVGYMRVKQFQGSTAEDIRREMAELSRQGLKGLIIDLRGNPGGLLDQAIKVSDIFLDGGTVVTTVGNAGKSRDEKRARNDGNEPHIPLVVLVNGSSASASEIVAGALKNLDRAVILGQTTFGKGSVQVLYDNDDDSALKLTIAQYLTPGDLSIQSVGITPDVQTVPVRIEKDGIWFSPSAHAMLRESELEQHLDSRNARKGEKPAETVKYLAPPPKKSAAAASDDDEEAADEEAPIVEDEQPKEDFEIELARDMLASLPSGVWKRHDVLAAGKAMIEKTRGTEDQKIGGALGKLGIDWTDGPAQGTPKLAASVTSDKASNKVAAGQKLTLRATVRNDGNGPAEQVHAKIKSDYYLFDERELVFGRVEPGQTKNAEIQVKVPKDALTQIDDLRFEFAETHNAKVDPAQLKVQIDGLPRPVFAYTYQIVDDIQGNQDGLVQRGEHVRLLVTVKNQGPGRSYKTQATLKNNSGPGVFIHKGRFRIDNIAAGQTKEIAFDFEVQPDLQDDTVNLELAVADQTVHEYVNEKLKFPVAQAGKAPVASSGMVTVTKDHAELRSAAAQDAPVVGYAAKQATFKVTGKSADGTYTRVEIEPGRPAFVQTAAVKSGGSSKAGGFEPMWMVSPPVLALSPAALETGDGKMHLHGQAKDERKVSDVYVVVQNHNAKIDLKKVFYKSNRNGSDPRKMDFDVDVPLWPGENYVHVVARENGQVQSRQTLVVLREGGTPGNAAALSEPRPSSKN